MWDMTSKERVLRAIRREPQDRTPLDFAGMADTISKLEAHFGCTGYDAVLQCLGIDFRTAKPRYVGPPRPRRADGSFQDVYGAWRRSVRFESGRYDEIVERRDFHEMARTGKEVFEPGHYIPDHAALFGQFPFTEPASGRVRYVLYSFRGQASVGEVYLILESDSGRIVEFNHIEAWFE